MSPDVEDSKGHKVVAESFGPPWTRSKLAVASGVLLAWTAVLCLGAYISGINFGQPTAQPLMPRRPQGLSSGPSRSLLGTDSDEVERRWTDKLIGDLQSTATDESVSATLSELRSTLSAREERLQQLGSAAMPAKAPTGATAAAGAVPSSSSSSSSLSIPRYDRNSVAELQKAALAAALPTEARGPLPQLVRDLGAALARQQQEHELLQKRLSQLQPSVINYNPKEVDQLTKAVAEATAAVGPEVGGPLPKLLKDLSAVITSQQHEGEKQKKALELEGLKKSRSARRAANLKTLLMRTSPRTEDRVALLFEEVSDRCTQAYEDAKHGYEQASKPDGADATSREEAARWQDSIDELRTLVLDELKAAAERNATLGLSYDEERTRRLALEARVLELTTPPPLYPPPPPPPLYPPPPPPLQMSGATPAAGVGVDGFASAASGPALGLGAAIGAVAAHPGAGMPLAALAAAQAVPPAASGAEAAAPALGSAVAASVAAPAAVAPATAAITTDVQQAPMATPSVVNADPAASAAAAAAAASSVAVAAPEVAAPEVAAQTSPPPPPASSAAGAHSGACAGKRCPAGYEMIDRGDRCTCRPLG